VHSQSYPRYPAPARAGAQVFTANVTVNGPWLVPIVVGLRGEHRIRPSVVIGFRGHSGVRFHSVALGRKVAHSVTFLATREKVLMTSSQSSMSKDVSSRGESSALVSSLGNTTIADTVVSKIAGIATRDVDGVHAVGGGTARAVGALRERIPGARTNHSQGVSVEVGEKQAAIDLDIVADYGVAIADLATGIRRHVIEAVERMTGLQVTEVNVTVHDVYLDDGSNDDDNDAPARVQ